MSRPPQVRKRTAGLAGAGLVLGAVGGWLMGLLRAPRPREKTPRR